jgi:hypothetical protein
LSNPVVQPTENRLRDLKNVTLRMKSPLRQNAPAKI